MLIAIASLLAFAAVVFLVNGLRQPQVDPIEARMRAIQAGMARHNPALARPFVNRAIGPVVGGFAGLLIKLLPTTWVKATERRLVWAGSSVSLPGFVMIVVVASVGFAVCAFVMAHTYHSSSIVTLIATVGGGGGGIFFSQFWLNAKISDRNYRARKGLPDALDLMLTSVEAGLSLDAALMRVAEYQRGPFQDELLVAIQDMSLGKSRRQALEEICERLNVPEVITFVQTINQAEVTGAPIGQVLRVQAEQVRIKRRQAAEAQAQRAPLLMIIPLVLFIFPSLFMVLLAPAAISIIDLFQNSPVFGR